MKNWKQKCRMLSAGLMAALSLGMINNSSAQTAAGTPEFNYPFPLAGVTNTGADIAFMQTVGDIGVNAWDGADPGFGIYDYGNNVNLSMPLPSGSTDPDVAYLANAECFVVVYENGGEIYKQSFTYDPGGPSINPTGPIQMVSTGSGVASYPNIDSGDIYRGAIVWQEFHNGKNMILGRGVDMCGSGLYPTMKISAPFTKIASQPDVSIYRDGPDEYIMMTYVAQEHSYAGSYDLIYHIEKASTFHAGVNGTVHWDNPVVMSSMGGGEKIFNPRIASQYQTGTSVLKAATMVFNITSGGGPFSYHIWTYNFSGGTSYLTQPSNLSSCVNQYPVISWTDNNEYVTAWHHAPSSLPGCPGLAPDIISIKTDPAGVPVSTSLSDYQWLNAVGAGGSSPLEYGVSIASRYSQGGVSLFSTFAIQAYTRVFFKRTNSGATPYFREAATTDVALDIYPNPATDVLNIEMDGLEAVQLSHISGQLVGNYTTNEGHALQIALDHLPAGLYIVDVTANGQQIRKKISVL